MNNSGIITLLTANGKEVRFVEIAGIAYEDGFYSIMKPIELLEGMREDEVIIFKVTRGENNKNRYVMELNEDICKGVLDEHERLIRQLLDIAGDGTDTDK